MKNEILLVGYGRIGKRHAEHIKTFAKLKGIVEINSTRLKEAQDCYGDDLSYYKNLEDVASGEYNLAAICTPNGSHYKDSTLCLDKGMNLLIEKPLTLSVRQSLSLLGRAETLNLRVFAVKQNRFNPPVEFVQNLLSKKALGDIYSFQLNCFWNRNQDYYTNSDWKGTIDLDGGVLYTQFSHFLDLLVWLLGEMDVEASYVSRLNKNRQIAIEDGGTAILKSIDGEFRGTLNYTINAFRKNMEGSLTIFGQKGTVKIGGQYLNELEYFEVEDHETPTLAKGNRANNYGTYTGSMSNHDKVYANLVEVLNGNAAIKTSGIDAVRSISLIQTIYEKANYWGC